MKNSILFRKVQLTSTYYFYTSHITTDYIPNTKYFTHDEDNVLYKSKKNYYNYLESLTFNTLNHISKIPENYLNDVENFLKQHERIF